MLSRLESAIIVPDASLLLELYECDEQKRHDLVETLRRYRKQIWVADWTRREVRRRLPLVRSRNRSTAVGYVHKKMIKSLAEIELSLAKRGDLKPAFSPALILNEHSKAFIRSLIDGYDLSLMEAEARANRAADDLLAILLRDDNVGAPFEKAHLETIMRCGPARYAAKVPPGYADSYKAGKREPERVFGDLIFWEQVLEFASRQGSLIVVVTAELKDDWWDWSAGIRRVHPLLVSEMRYRSGNEFDLLHSDDLVFLMELERDAERLVFSLEAVGSMIEAFDHGRLPELVVLGNIAALTRGLDVERMLASTGLGNIAALTRGVDVRRMTNLHTTQFSDWLIGASDISTAKKVRRNARRRAQRRRNRDCGICTICGKNEATTLQNGKQLASCAKCRSKARRSNS